MNKKILLLTFVLFLIYLGLTVLGQPAIKSALKVAVSPAPPITQGSPANERITYNCVAGRTVFDLLQSQTSDLEVKEYSFGKLVTSINHLTNGTDGKYWTYFVDDKSASVSADNYKCRDSEKVEWGFGKAQ